MELYQTLYATVKSKKQPEFLQVYSSILASLQRQKEEADIAPFISIVPEFCNSISIYDRDLLSQCIQTLVTLDSSVYLHLRDYLK